MSKEVNKETCFFKCSTLKVLMKSKGWNARQLSIKSGLSSGQISNILTGKRQPRIDSAVLLAKALEVPISRLIEDPYSELKADSTFSNSDFSESLENFIVKTMQKCCKNCEKSPQEIKFTERYEILTQDEAQLLADFRRDHGCFEDSRADEASACNDSKDRICNQSPPGRSTAG